MNLYLIVDEKAHCVCMSFSSINETTARRSFEDLIAALKPSVFTMHPGDFSLYGSIQVLLENGVPVMYEDLVKICSGNDYSPAVLATLRQQRAEAFNTLNEKEVSGDGN